MILVYEVGRTHHMGMPHVPLPTLGQVIAAYEHMAGFAGGGRVIGVALNSRRVSAAEAAEERDRVRGDLGLPAADPVRHGCGELLDAVEALRRRRTDAAAGGRPQGLTAGSTP